MQTSLSLKISLTVFLVVLTFGSALAIFYYLDQKAMLQHEQSRVIEILGISISGNFAEAASRHDLKEMNRILEDAVLDEQVAYVIAKSRDGNILASRWTAQTRGGIREYSFPLQARLSSASQSDDLFGPVRGRQVGQTLGNLTIGIDLSHHRAYQRHIIMRTVIALLAAALVSLLSAVWFVRYIFKRALTPLLTGIAAVGAGKLDSRIPPDRHEEIGAIAAAFNDMTERLAATLISKERLEAAIQQRTADLVEKEERIRLLLDSTAEAIYGIDLKGNCTFSNTACLRLLGYERPEDLVGRNMHRLIHHTNKDGSPHPAEECLIYAANRTGTGHHSADEIFWKADGTSINVEYWSYPIVEGKKHIGAVVTFLDITDKVRLEGQLQQSQKLEAIGLLAGGIAHDFNNILTAIVGYGNLLQRRVPAGDRMRAHVDQILASAERATQLTRGLLAFSRKQALQTAPVRLNEIIVRQEKMLRMIIGEDIEMKTILRQNSVILADSGQIEQVLMNLATNARDAMPRGGSLTFETDRVTLTESFVNAHGFGAPGDYAVVSVTDTGTGMDEATQQKIFDPFFTTKEVGRGTGLGLAIIYGIVKQHKGYINVYSQPGEGTTFKLYLPIHHEEGVEQAAPETPVLMRGSETVLLAEDDPTLRAFFRDVLHEHGYTVFVAANGQEALDQFTEQKEKIQLIILDMIMPKMSGREVFDAIRSMTPGVKALFTSGYTADKVQQEGLPAGCAFVAKPVTPQDYLRKVREVLDA